MFGSFFSDIISPVVSTVSDALGIDGASSAASDALDSSSGLDLSGLTSDVSGLSSDIGDLGSTLGSDVGSLGSTLGSDVGSLGSTLGSDIGGLTSDVGSLGSTLGSDVGSLGSTLGSDIGGLTSDVGDLGSTLGSDIGGLSSDVGGLSSDIGNLGSDVSDLGSSLGSNISSLGSSLTSGISGLGSQLANQISSGNSSISSGLSSLANEISNNSSNAITPQLSGHSTAQINLDKPSFSQDPQLYNTDLTSGSFMKDGGGVGDDDSAPTIRAFHPHTTQGLGFGSASLMPINTSSALRTAPHFADGGHVPEFYSEGGLKNRYVKGAGDGTSDDVPAMLANGEFVIPADVVSGLGNGSNDSGAKVLDEFLQTIRAHKKLHDAKHLPPDSKGALAYLSEAHKKVKA